MPVLRTTRVIPPGLDVAAATAVRRKPSLDFSVTGLVYSSLMMFMGLAAINSQANLLFAVFGLMIGILLVSWAISRMVLKRLRVTRVLPEHAVVGQRVGITYEFSNGKRYWPSLSVCMGELDGVEAFTKQPQAYLLHAAAKMTASVPVEVVPKRRGLHELRRHQLSTSFPFGFVKRAIERERADTLLVYPALADVDRKVLSLARSTDAPGPTVKPRRDGTDEFYGLREYRRGENPRQIYWRRSARTGTLVTKELTHVSPPRLLLLVDTYLPVRALSTHVAVERAIAMAASLASFAMEQSMDVGLLAWSAQWQGLAPNHGKRQRRELLTALARLPLNSEHPSHELLQQAQEMQRAGTTAVLITPGSADVGLGERVRGGLVVISSTSPQAQAWFRFGAEVDFSRCMPVDQQPPLGGAVTAVTTEADKRAA